MFIEMQVKTKQIIVKSAKDDSLGLEGDRGFLLLKTPENWKQI